MNKFIYLNKIRITRKININIEEDKTLFAKTSDWSWAVVCQLLVSRVARDLETEMDKSDESVTSMYSNKI